MTTLGKVFAFVNFVFALVTGGLIMMVYLTGTNWKAGFDRERVARLQEQNENLTLREENKKLTDQRDAADGRTKSEKDAREALEKKYEAANADLKDRLDKEIANRQAGDINSNATLAANKGLEEENKNLRTINADRDKRLVAAAADVDKYRSEGVRAQIELTSMRDRVGNLLQQLEDMARELEKSRSRTVTAGLTSVTGGNTAITPIKNPPGDDVEGLVKASDPKTGLVTITIGTDAGVNKDNTLEVFRLSPPTYLGTIRIIDVRANEAVGQLVNGYNRREQVKIGDSVAAHILGGQRR